jgi:succinoglycan biosynthesis transport protein ExoP
MRAASVAVTPAKEDFVFSDLWLIVRKRRFLVGGMAIGLAILATATGLHRGKMYTARGEIQIQPGAASEFKLSLSSVLGSGGGSLDVVIESDTRILTSDKVLLTVARTLKLQDNPAFFGGRSSVKAGMIGGKAAPLEPVNLDDPHVRNAILGTLRGHLVIARVPRTQMISLSYTSASPQLSADIVNTLESEFIKNNFIAHYSNTQQVTNWLTSQIDDLRAVVQSSQDRMVDLQKNWVYPRSIQVIV